MKKIIKYLQVFFLLAMVPFACASWPKSHLYFQNYSEIQINENTFHVKFSVLNHLQTEDIIDYALLKSAELVYRHGYNYFIIIEQREQAINVSYTTPAQMQTELSAYYHKFYGFSVSHEGKTYLLATPSGSNTIICFKEKPEGFIYNAKYLINSIREKYNRPVYEFD